MVNSSGRLNATHRAPTLRTVAAEAGCSIATVSKALNGLTVSEENLRRVREAAERLGYVPNQAARSMRGAGTMTVGIIMNVDVHPAQEVLATLDRLIVDMEIAGYSVFLSVAGRGQGVDELLRRYAERRVDGLFYWNANDSPALSAFRDTAVPVLAIGHRDHGCADLPMLISDSTDAYELMYKRVRQLGHRCVLEMVPGIVSHVHQAAAGRAGLEWAMPDVAPYRDDLVDLLTCLAERSPLPLIVAPYPVAIEVLLACELMGLRVPDDLSLVSSTDSAGAGLLRTPLATMRTDYDRIGSAAATAMKAMLDGVEPGDIVVPDTVTWIERDSLGPAPR